MILSELASILGGELQGDPQLEIKCACGIDEQRPQAITFAENAKALAQAERQGFVALIISSTLNTDLPIIRVKNPRIAYAKALAIFNPPIERKPGCHPTSIISPTAHIDPTAYIGPLAIVADGARVGKNSVVEAQVKIGAHSILGDDSRLLAHTILGDNCQVGSKCLVGAHTQIIGGTIIGDDVEIGARCILDGCQISPKCRLDNMATMCKGSSLAPGAIMVSQSTVQENGKVGTFAILAAQAIVRPNGKVGDFAQIGGRCIVENEIPAGQGQWSGNPPLPYRDDMRRLAKRDHTPRYLREIQDKLKRK